MKKNDIDLLPCPHCGGAATLFRYAEWGNPLIENDIDHYYIMTRCTVCGAVGAQRELADYETWQDWEKIEATTAAGECAAAWNLRTVPQDIADLIDERIRAALTERGRNAQDAAGDANGSRAEKTPTLPKDSAEGK